MWLGAHSWVRKTFNIDMEGEQTSTRPSFLPLPTNTPVDFIWGVIDTVPTTDFPDIRRKTAIHSASEGSLLIIPREGDFLVRMYIELDKLNVHERVSERNITLDQLIAAAGRILRPYTLEKAKQYGFDQAYLEACL